MRTLLSILIGSLLLLTSDHRVQAEHYSRGLWYDVAGISTKNLVPQISKFHKLGVTRVHIVVSSSIFGMGLYKKCQKIAACAARKYIFGFDNWLPIKGKAQLGQFVEALNGASFEVILTIWPEPNNHYLASLSRLAAFVARHHVYGIELEDEENWKSRFSDFGDLSSASRALFSTLRNSLPAGVKIGVTTAPRDFARSAFQNDELLRQADFISFQTYQDVCTAAGTCSMRNITGNYAPGKMQERAMQLIESLDLGDKPLILGLPAYDQETYKTTGQANMYFAAKQTICDAAAKGKKPNVVGDAYWSAGNITSARRDHAYALQFLENCSVSEIKSYCNRTVGLIGDELTVVCPGFANN